MRSKHIEPVAYLFKHLPHLKEIDLSNPRVCWTLSMERKTSLRTQLLQQPNLEFLRVVNGFNGFELDSSSLLDDAGAEKWELLDQELQDILPRTSPARPFACLRGLEMSVLALEHFELQEIIPQLETLQLFRLTYYDSLMHAYFNIFGPPDDQQYVPTSGDLATLLACSRQLLQLDVDFEYDKASDAKFTAEDFLNIAQSCPQLRVLTLTGNGG